MTVKHVVSVSLGSSKRDFREEVTFLGETVLVERIGTDGDLAAYARKFTELDGKVDALGVGGADLYVYAGKRRYTLHSVAKLISGVKTTPILDGSGLKNSLERETARYLQEHGLVDFPASKTLLVIGCDRFGLAEELAAFGGPVIYGDLMFSLGIPIPIRSLGSLNFLVRALMPIIGRLPFKWLYPTGSAQEETRPKYTKYFEWADILAGDFHPIRRYMPERLDGKTILTNTIREKDIELLRERGVKRLVTSTPEIDGKSPGTNVFEALIVALSDKPAHELTPEDYMAKVHAMGWKPRVVDLA